MNEEKKVDKEPGKGSWKHRGLIAGGIFLCTIAGAGGVYAYQAQKYETVFFPNTAINGLDASGKGIDEVKSMIEEGMEGYTLTLESKQGEEQIAGSQIGLHAEFDGSLEQILAAQDPYEWGLHLMESSVHTITTMMAYEQEQLEQVLKSLDCMNSAKTLPPKDACLSEYIPGTGYEVIPEETGDRLVYEYALEEVSKGILNLSTRLSFEELDVYEKPEIVSASETLQRRLQEWNRYANVVVNYQFGDKGETLDGSTIHTWISSDEAGNPILDEALIATYVKELAETYNTAYKSKTLETFYGPTVTINRGHYGWRINQGAETAALIAIVRSGEGQTREPVYSQTAASYSGDDYGDTYVEINLTAQHLFFYKNGELLVESDFVSGNVSKGWGTPGGAFPLTYKQRDATLRGEGYATPVSYWMPFNGGIGMHDASWRSGFGGSIYKTGGSHGCINLPPAVAKTIYENISAGIPVLCYNLDGTEKGASSTPPAETKSQATTAPPPATTPSPTAAPTETSSAVAPQETSPPPTEATIIPVETTTPQGETENKAPAGPGEVVQTQRSEAVGPGV